MKIEEIIKTLNYYIEQNNILISKYKSEKNEEMVKKYREENYHFFKVSLILSSYI